MIIEDGDTALCASKELAKVICTYCGKPIGEGNYAYFSFDLKEAIHVSCEDHFWIKGDEVIQGWIE